MIAVITISTVSGAGAAPYYCEPLERVKTKIKIKKELKYKK